MKTLLLLTLTLLVSCGKPLSVKKPNVEPSMSLTPNVSPEPTETITVASDTVEWATECTQSFNPSHSYQETLVMDGTKVTYSKVVFSDMNCRNIQEFWKKTYLYEFVGETELNVILLRNKVTYYNTALIDSLNEAGFCDRVWEFGKVFNVVNQNCALPSAETQFANSKVVNFELDEVNQTLSTNLTTNKTLQGFY